MVKGNYREFYRVCEEEAECKCWEEQGDGITSVFVGYTFNDSWALELGYSQYELDDSRSNDLGVVSVNGQDYWQEMDWDSSIKAKQISFAPVYTYAMDDKWSLKFKAGVTYTQYESKAGKYEELELLINDDVEINNTLSHSSGLRATLSAANCGSKS